MKYLILVILIVAYGVLFIDGKPIKKSPGQAGDKVNRNIKIPEYKPTVQQCLKTCSFVPEDNKKKCNKYCQTNFGSGSGGNNKNSSKKH